MSVIYTNKNIAILDHEAWIINTYNCIEGNKIMFQELFDLRTPFLMDDQARKRADEMEAGDSDKTQGTARHKKKKRKKEHAKEHNEETEAEVRHIEQVFCEVRLTQQFKDHFNYIPTSQDYTSNNSRIRDLRKRFTEATNSPLPPMDEHSSPEKIHYKEIDGIKYIVPRNVRYVCGDAGQMLTHTPHNILYDIIVLDPPWSNKYIKRRKTAHGDHHGYDMMTVEDILQLPIGNVLNDGALVAIWCTNNQSHIQQFIAGLHSWGVQLVATWYWLKVTRSGEPITQLTNLNKKPYERLFIAKKIKSYGDGCNNPEGLNNSSTGIPEGLNNSSTNIPESLNNSSTGIPESLYSSTGIPEGLNNSSTGILEGLNNSSTNIPESLNNSSTGIPESLYSSTGIPEGLNNSSTGIPEGLVFCSVPSGLHSHKPPLEELLKPYVKSEPNCLEVFARSLIPGWTSCGLEVLRLQHYSLYQNTTS